MVQEVVEAAPPEPELPIDIDYAKFLHWLIDRRRIPRDWHTLLKSARALARNALSSTPHSARTHLNLPEPPATVPYFTAVDALAAVTSSEAPPEWNAGPDKDILGRYKGPTARAWADAVSAFERRDVYLADCAQLLTRNADIEASALKTAMTRLQTDITEYARRDAPAVRAAAEAKQRFQAALAEFDLPEDGEADFQTLLAEAVERRVPMLLAEAVQKAKTSTFSEAVNYYKRFAEHVQDADSPVRNDELCVTIMKVVTGNVDELSRPIKRKSDDSAGLDLDFNALDLGISDMQVSNGGQGDVVEIDWGIEIDTTGTAEAAHEATKETIADDAQLDSEISQTVTTIDWNETIEVSNEVSAEAEAHHSENCENSDTLSDTGFRQLYLNDLIEVDAFLAQRVSELSLSGDTEVALIMQQASGTPDFLKAVGLDEIKDLQGSVQEAIDAINSVETRRLLALQSDSRRLERAAKAVLEKKHIAERMHSAIDILRNKRVKAVQDLANETPKFDELAKATKDVKKRTEQALSRLYKGRTVNILGEINNIFPPDD